MKLFRKILLLAAAALLSAEAAWAWFGAGFPAVVAFGGDPVEFTDGAYRVSVTPETEPRGRIMCYVPRYKPVDRMTADMYASLAGVNENFSETGDAYVYESRAGSLEVDKWINMLRYENSPDAFVRTEPLRSDGEAVKAAEAFVRGKYLRLAYEESKVKFDGNSYLVNFIDRIGNLWNYAFPTSVRLDARGNVLSIYYFYIQYDRLRSCDTISMSQALKCLPPVPDLGGPDGGPTVLIDRARLVYYYEDSIVQPAYLFEGQAAGGKAYECFVKAAKYSGS
ncbi:MAG: hypothetical protein FWC55_04925 [Firmicutes bacterium]|nr:hypothetical protein [Bacillota bacterium]